MSDLQMITGMSILVSGYIQMSCGITTYEWMVVVSLAWFSCITHLSCLSLLRGYLYKNAAERTWRLCGMGVMAVLQIIGLVFTGNYQWSSAQDDLYSTGITGTAIGHDPVTVSKTRLNDFAICNLNVHASNGPSFISMIVSLSLVVLGYFGRIVKVHKRLSVDVVWKIRAWLSEKAQKPLQSITRSCMTAAPRALKRTLVYHPFLAAFLTGRFLLDVWSSVLMEVSIFFASLWPCFNQSKIAWLLISFAWGLYRLVSVLAVQRRAVSQSGTDRTLSFERANWTFGQVASVALLLAPLITIFEYLNCCM